MKDIVPNAAEIDHTDPRRGSQTGRYSTLRRLAVPLFLVVGLVAPLAVSSWYTFSLQRQTLEKAFEFEMDQIARTLANGMAGPVWNLIPNSGRPLLESIMEDPRVLSVTVESDAQGVFLSAAKDGRAAAHSIALSHDIVFAGGKIGTATLRIDSATMFAPMVSQWRRIGIVGAIQIAFIVAVVSLLIWFTNRWQRASVLRQVNDRLENEIAERTGAEQQLHASEARYRSIIENMVEAFYRTDRDGRVVMVSPAVEELLGYTPEEAIGIEVVDLYADPDRHETFLRSLADSDGRLHNFQTELLRKDGSTLWVSTTAQYVRDDDGNIAGIEGTARNIADQRRAEEQLRQAQKMEAVGQLTGGVAHDFNNLLAVILGNAELLRDEIGDNRAVTVIERSATRGAELTQRLLAFSRQQSLRPRTIVLADLIADLDDLLHRTLGAPVRIVTEVPEGLWPVVADPGQLENALLNLAINARDAMPNGGVLEICCANAEVLENDTRTSIEAPAGDYVRIVVRDSGKGMPADVREHAFEPFFTTKDIGEGTGLGLSMVYGFTRQSGGDAVIASAPGKGTEITLFLPRAAAGDVYEERAEGGKLKRGQGQTILVLEDEPDVRNLALTILDGLGYRVLGASDANAAMLVLEEETGNIDLLLSDVVLPGGVNGPQFVAEALRLYPKLKVVFMTGYSSGATLQDQPIATGMPVLRKPFRSAALANLVHDILAAESLRKPRQIG